VDGESPLGGNGSPIVEEPLTLLERTAVAEVCMAKLALEPMVALVDGMDNQVNLDYAAAPDRLYLVGQDGNIAYRGGPGPMGFAPDELRGAIEKEVQRRGQPSGF
jgi:hypothetical protein